jgi:hypothetical protein
VKPSALFSFLIASMVAVVCAAAPHQVTVTAGEHDRDETIVSFAAPSDVADGTYELRAEKTTIPLQIHGGRGLFRVDGLKAGQSRTYTIEPTRLGLNPITVSADGTVVHATFMGRPIFDYQGAPVDPPPGVEPVFKRGGYINHMLTPSGLRVDDDYPLNHKHHHGIWSVWTKTEFEGRHPDFWNMGDKTGTAEGRGFKDVFSGPVAGGFHAEHQMIDLTANPPKAAINEQWDVTVYSVGQHPRPYYLYDIVIHQQCATDTPLVLPDYRYGGLGFRGATEWNGVGKYTFLTSEGKDVKNGNGTRARWCYTGGSINGKPAGVTIFCGPDSFRAPQPVRLNPDQPFFCYSPPAMGEFSITPQNPYYARYRFLVADGEPDKELIEKIWNDYATPPTVQVN